MSVSVGSLTTVSDTSSLSITINKPTGLAVGDLLVFCVSRATNTLYSLSGWTSLVSVTPDSTNSAKQVLYKTADSGDVAASNFTFTSTGVDTGSAGVLYRIVSNTATTLNIVSFDSDGEGDTTTPTYSLEVSPFTTSALYIGMIGVNSNVRVSGYTLSPTNPTWTEDADFGNSDAAIATITANPTALTQTTQLTATLASTGRSASILLVVGETANVTGTNDLLSATPTFFATSSTVDTNVTADLLTATPQFFDVTGRTREVLEWTDEKQNTSTWTNEKQ